jgi:predicted HicB family RNase H-like nuclease
MSKKEPTLLTLDPQVKAEAKEEAEKHGHSLSHVVEEMLRLYVKMMRRQD